jgi:hypothetical protein
VPYSTPNDVRLRAVGMTEEVIPDVSSTSLNLTTCIEEADAEINEAARAGDYEVPFDPAPDRIRDLSAVGALARARRALELGNQPAAEPDTYRREFDAGLELLRQGKLDLGTVAVSDELTVMPTADRDWVQLPHRGLILGSVTVANEAGTFTYVEDRREYEPGYRPDSVKDYEMDHRAGLLRRLLGGRISPGQTVSVGYEYYYRQPGRAQDAEYAGRTAAADRLTRLDQRD